MRTRVRDCWRALDFRALKALEKERAIA